MTNEELKKKIVSVLVGNIEYELQYYPDDNYTDIDFNYEKIADVLVETGFVDKSDYASMKETAVKYKAEVSKAESRAKEAEHRAARAERALRDELVQKAIRLCVTDIRPWYSQALEEAEKEIMEEQGSGEEEI